MKTRSLKGVLGLVIVCCFLFGSLSAATIGWNPFSTYTIPDDTNTYTFDWTYALTDDMTINGTFEIIGLGDLTCDHEIVVNDGGDFRVTASDGRSGAGGHNAMLWGGGEVSVGNGGLLQLSGGNGSDGVLMAFSGGNAIVNPSITIEAYGFLRGVGGTGGSSTSNYNSANGGVVRINGAINQQANGRIEFFGGNGGDGAAASTGNGGDGGTVNVFASMVLDGTLSATGGDGGDNGASSSGGDGGNVQFNSIATLGGAGSMLMYRGNYGSGTSAGMVMVGDVADGKLLISGKATPLELCDSIISLTTTLELNETWTICACDQKVYGNGNKIVLGASGEIVVPANCAVLFDNLEIEGVSDTNIRCLEDTSTLSFDNVVLDLDTSYAFTEGNLYFAGNCTVEGGGFTFGFESDGVMNIQPNSKLTFSPNTIFEYDTTPASLLVMAASSSILSLDNAKLLATQPLTLLTGILDIEGFGIVEGVGTLSLGGLRGMMIQGGLARVGDVTLS